MDMRSRSKWVVKLGLIVLLAFGVLCGFMNEAYAQDDVKIGVLAKRGAKKCLENWGATAEYLSKETGKSFVIVPLGFDAVPEALKAGDVDFFIVNSSMFCDMQKQFGGKEIASLINSREGKALTTFGGVILTRSDSPVNSLEDVKGKTFMCVKKSSFGGYQMAMRELIDAGVNPETDCAKFIEGEKHDNVALAVLNGAVEVGTVRTDTLERMDAEGTLNISDFKIINKQSGDFPFVYSTRLYPEWPIAKCKGTSDSLADEVSKALIAMSSDSAAAKSAKCVGWSKPLDYSDVVACMKELKLGAFAE